MSGSRVCVTSGVTFDVLAGDVIVHVPAVPRGLPASVVSLSGGAAEVFLRVVNGDEGVTVDTEHVSDLVSFGVVQSDVPVGVSRRAALKAGAVGVGAGIAVLALPQAAAAASVVADAGSGDVIELEGFWENPEPNGIRFVAEIPGRQITGEPDLVVEGLDGVIPYVDVLDVNGGFIVWGRDYSPGVAPSTPGDLIGTFTSDGQVYRVTFDDANND